ncbi:hypothetical protein X734_11875 [Mesorhizobium sp. L2C084A000]|nr:hypothetical protein X734_11875 [Mesorhizobium sp. L2C084A000]
MMPKSVKRFSDDIMLLFDLEGTCRLKTKKPPGMAAVRILLLQSSDRAQSSRRQRAPKVPIRGGQVDHEAHIVDAEALVTWVMRRQFGMAEAPKLRHPWAEQERSSVAETLGSMP